MLISPRQLIDRLRHPRSRADELVRLRARFRALPSVRDAGPERAASALRLRALRGELSRAIAAPDACRGCSKGHPEPAGRWSGGHCCSGKTLEIWSQEECAALKLAGTDAARLQPPPGDHAGCCFRGPQGCSLEPEDRPNLCVRYLCADLKRELESGEAYGEIARLSQELARERKRFDDLGRS